MTTDTRKKIKNTYRGITGVDIPFVGLPLLDELIATSLEMIEPRYTGL